MKFAIPNFLAGFVPNLKAYSDLSTGHEIEFDLKLEAFYEHGIFCDELTTELVMIGSLTRDSYPRLRDKYFAEGGSDLLYLRLVAQKSGKYQLLKELCEADKEYYDNLGEDLEEVFKVTYGMFVTQEECAILDNVEIEWEAYDVSVNDAVFTNQGFGSIMFESQEDFYKAKDVLCLEV